MTYSNKELHPCRSSTHLLTEDLIIVQTMKKIHSDSVLSHAWAKQRRINKDPPTASNSCSGLRREKTIWTTVLRRTKYSCFTVDSRFTLLPFFFHRNETPAFKCHICGFVWGFLLGFFGGPLLWLLLVGIFLTLQVFLSTIISKLNSYAKQSNFININSNCFGI